jgi:SOS-response transcriptional repressor LexA
MLRSQYHTFSSLQEEQQIQQDLKGILGENILKEIEEAQKKELIAEDKRTKETKEKLSKLKEATPEEAEKILKDLEKSGFVRKETTQRNDLEVTKPTEKKHNKSGNTNQNTALSSENKQGESSK